MAERKFMFMAVDGYSEESATTDHTVLSGLVIGSGSYSAGKITGVTAASAAGDVVIWGQSVTLGDVTLGSDNDLILSGGGEVTGLPTTPSGATAATSKAYVDSLLSGLEWKSPAAVLRIIDDSDQSGADPTAGSAGEAWLVNNWATETDGDIVEWDGSAWQTIVTNSGGEPPDGTRVVVIEASAAGSFAGEEDNIGTYDATGDAWTFDDSAEGWALIVTGEGSYYENTGWTYDNGVWVQFTGAGQINAGAGLDKDGNMLNVLFGDGITEASDYVAIDLGTDPGLVLTGTSPDKKLLVKPNNAAGIKLTSSGVEVEVETDGAITFDAVNGGLQVNLETTNPTLDIATNELGVKFSTTLSGLDQDANGLKVKVDGSTITIDGSGQLVASGADESTRIENDFTATEIVAKGDPVYWNTTADEFGKATAGTDAKAYVFGVAKAAIGAAAAGAIVSYGPAAGVLTGATPGAKYYLQAAGGIGTSVPGAGNRVILVGWAMNATDLWVQPIDYGKKAA